ncbi:MAG: hypothetical protein QM489_06610 [Candidatus Izemoplasma sp.]
MKNESMLYFSNLNDFSNFVYALDIYNGWRINSGILNSRGEKIRDKEYTKKLRKIFNDKKLFRRSVSISEIVSWLDSYLIINRFIFELQKNILPIDFDNFQIYCEYKINLSKMRRIDFILAYQNKVLLIEFRLTDKFSNLSNNWNKKMLELIIYKELLSNYLDSKTKIYLYAFISLPEYRDKEKLVKHIEYNNNSINHMVQYVIEYML